MLLIQVSFLPSQALTAAKVMRAKAVQFPQVNPTLSNMEIGQLGIQKCRLREQEKTRIMKAGGLSIGLSNKRFELACLVAIDKSKNKRCKFFIP